jgi:DNA polymerase-3 subunit beta
MEITTDVDLIAGDGDTDVCLPAHLLERIARQAGPAPVKIRAGTEGAQIDVADGDATYDLQGYPSTDYPELSSGAWTPVESFTNGRLASILDRVSTCISTEETRYYLNGVNWSIDTFGRCMTATDGHRLASARYDADGDDKPMSVIIPYGAVRVLRKLAKGQDVGVNGVWNSGTPAQEANPLAGYAGGAKEAVPPNVTRLEFCIGSTRLVTKTIDGTFPDWRRVVPKETPHAIDFDADLLRTALERVTMMASESGRAVRIYRGEDGKAALSIKNADSGEGHAKAFATWPDVPADPKESAERHRPPTYSSFGFNAAYLKAALGNNPRKFILRFADSGSPFIVDDGDEEMTRVLMPRHVV